MKNKGRVLIIDDNEDILTSLKFLLGRQFEKVQTERNPNTIPSLLRTESYDLYLLDMNFSAGMSTGNEGIFWMKKILEIDPNACIVFITAYGDVDLAVKAIKEGATDFIQKPWENEKLLTTLQNAYRLRMSHQEISQLKQKQHHLIQNIDRHYDFIPGSSSAMQRVMDTINKVASTEANVLIHGENGTGKELVAREIHRRSKRNQEVFIPVDMGSISPTLFESELFGHMKGAFTGASEDRPGRFVLASGGTLFLDEIGNLPYHLQSKILTVLQSREVLAVGSGKPIPVDIRLISASNKTLQRMVEEQQFREDLLYRINTIEISIPPLRERKEDIHILAKHFLHRFAMKYKREEPELHPRALRRLMDYPWPGNIREFEHFMEKVIILNERSVVTLDDIPLSVYQENSAESPSSLNLEENEKHLVRKALKKSKGNMSAAALELGVSRKTLYNKISKYRL